MSKNSIVAALAEHQGLTKKQARATLAQFLGIITDELKSGNRVTLTGFGTFVPRSRRERNGVNPQTKEKMVIPAHRTVGFVAGKNLKRAVK